MRLNNRWLEPGLGFLALGTAACSSSSPALAPSCSATASNNVVTAAPAAAANVITVTVNGNCTGSGFPYANEPCASIQVCNPGTSTCHTIGNLLVDTGSYGIRIFSSVLTAAGLTGTMIPSGGGNLGECVGFGDSSSEFGPVENFGVILGGENEIMSMPIMVINDTSIAGFNGPPSACKSPNSNPDTGPAETGFNGILGVGLFDEDCGGDCANSTDNGMYFSCSGSTCTGAAASAANQVRNPVAALAVATPPSLDNNGVVMMFPGVPDGGAASVTGALVLGIGTRANNMPANVQKYQADGEATFSTVFNPFSSTPLSGFIDSGTNTLNFPWPPPSAPDNGLLPDCGTNASGYYCPGSEQGFAAANTGVGGSPTSCVAFSVANASSQFSSSNQAFSNVGTEAGGDISSEFDWGLPFFYGRSVFVGISGKSATGLGTGPYWAY